MSAVPRPTVNLLGGFAAESGGTSVPDSAWRLRKAKELVKLLALADGHRLHREQAMDALWPDRGPDSAGNNLNQAVHAARRALGAEAITLLDGVLRLEANVDVEAFQHAAANARRQRTAQACQSALALYGGELLPENRYDDWASLERERLADLQAELEQLLAELGGARPALRPLPVETSTFVGREHELGELAALLAHTRLLTLTGAGGVGKTRLALELARDRAPAYKDSVLFVELDSTTDGAQVPGAVAEALDLRALRGEAPAVLDALLAELESLEFLLVLDNCEHLIGPTASLVDSLLRGTPQLTVLATSREPLRVPGEVVFRVPSLGIPDPDREEQPEALLRYEAVRLFVERAGAVAPGFALDHETAPGVARICHRLDGLPLALELAAARVDALTPAVLAARLDDRFRFLRAGSRAAPTRQQTLEATLDWSHELLSVEESTLLRRLAIFSGSFPLEAVEEVCAGDGLEPDQVALVLADLVDKSLVASEDRRGRGRRYRLLETIRSYAATRLAESAERPALAARHAAWLVNLVTGLDGQLTGLDSEQGNLRVALETLLDTNPEEALRLSAAVWPFWLRRIELPEARHWLTESLERAPGDSPERIRALLGDAAIEFRSGDAGFGLAKVEEAVALARRLGDPALEWRTLHFRAAVEIAADDGVQAASFYEPALALAREHGLAEAEAVLSYSLGAAAWVVGDIAVAERLCEESYTLFGALADSKESVPALVNVAEMIRPDPATPGVRIAFEDTLQPFADISCRVAAGYVLINWANVVRSAGDERQGRERLEQGLSYFERIGSDQGRADAWARLANLELSEGRLDEAADFFERARPLREQLGDRRGVALALVGLGQVATRRGEYARAADLLQEALATFRRAGDRWGLVSTLWRIADLELARDRPAEAEERLGEALTVVGETRRMRWQAVTCANLAELALLRGDDAEARALFEQALEGFEARGDSRWVEHVQERLSAANPAQIER
jgi:predicted ATPase